MDDMTGFVAVIMLFGIPLGLGGMYTYYRVCKLRAEERMAAIARGANLPLQPDLSQAAQSRRSGILLVAGALGYMVTFALIARAQPDAWVPCAFGVIPLFLGLGFLLDSVLVRREMKSL